MVEIWNSLLTALGSMLSFFYDLVPSYIVAIILLTIAVRVLLLPLTIKQTRSMQEMQKLQPKLKELQRKYKGNRQKLNEEMMKLYKEHQVNPLGGCLPLLLQLPVFFALFRVLTVPSPGGLPGTRYLPEGSRLFTDLEAQRGGLLGLNLACSPTQAGRGLVEVARGAEPVSCGESWLVALPVYLLVGLMVGTTWYQQRQMQRATPGGQQPQMQLMARIMPVFLGFISINIASGVLVYWVTTNVWQIGQQYVMLRSRDRVAAADAARPAARATPEPREPEKPSEATGRSRTKGRSGASPDGSKGKSGKRGKGSGGRSAGSRKKRRKR